MSSFKCVLLFLLALVQAVAFANARTLRSNMEPQEDHGESDAVAAGISAGPSTDGPVLSNAKPVAGGRGTYVPTVNFEDTAYSNDYWISQDRLVEYKDKIDQHVARPEVSIDESGPKRPSLLANTAAQAAVKSAPAPPTRKSAAPKQAPAPSPAKKPVNAEPEEAEKAMKNTAKEVTKQIDDYQKKIARQNAASMGKIPENVKKGKSMLPF